MRDRLTGLADRIRKGEDLPFPLAALLSGCTPAVRLGMWLRLRGTPVQVPARVISFGNITAGGTGKTPAVIERARAELAAGGRVAVLTRGYGSKGSKAPMAFQEEDAARLTAGEFGDEPLLIARKAPGVVIVKCPDRVAGARLAIEQHGCNVLILDDGFQHVRIVRDENILLVDATNPFGNRRLLPRGLLREPLAAMRRATSIVVTRCDQARDLPGLLAELRDLCPGAPVRLTYHRPVGLWRVADGQGVPLEAIRSTRVSAVCAIANPDAFQTTLESVGAIVAKHHVHLDHAVIPRRDLESETMIIMTEKDAVRLRGSGQAPISSNVYALEIELCDFAYPEHERP